MKRAEARKLGLKHYNTGKPCKHGHFADKITNSGQCMRCRADKAKIYYHDGGGKEARQMSDLVQKQLDRETFGRIVPCTKRSVVPSETMARIVANTKCAVDQSGKTVAVTRKVKEMKVADLEGVIERLWTEQGGQCAISRVAFDELDREKMAGLDRIDSYGHYEDGNLQLVTSAINRWKGDQPKDAFVMMLIEFGAGAALAAASRTVKGDDPVMASGAWYDSGCGRSD
jgi:hypothetical protein